MDLGTDHTPNPATVHAAVKPATTHMRWGAAFAVLVLVLAGGYQARQQWRLAQANEAVINFTAVAEAINIASAGLDAEAPPQPDPRAATLSILQATRAERQHLGTSAWASQPGLGELLGQVDRAQAALSQPGAAPWRESPPAAQARAALRSADLLAAGIDRALNQAVALAIGDVQRSFYLVYGLTVAALLAGWYQALRAGRARADTLTELHASEETYRSMVVALNDGVLIFDLEGQVQAVNPAAERYLGRSSSELQQTRLSEWVAVDIHGKPVVASELPVAKALREQRPQRGTVLGLTNPAGVLSWFDVNVEPLQDEASGRMRGVVASISDITLRRQAEAGLTASDANHQLMMNAMADGMFVAQNYRFVYSNAALAKMLGYEPGAFVDIAFDRVVAPGVLPLWTERFSQRVSTQAEPQRSYEVRFMTRDGNAEIELELVASRAMYQGKPAVLGLVRDITERKKVAAELEGYRNRLEKLVEERTEALSAALAAQAETENFAQTMTDKQPTLLAYMSTDLRQLFLNQAYLNWFGRTREEMIGRTLSEVLGVPAILGREELVGRVLDGEAIEAPLDLVDARGQIGHFWTFRQPDIREGKVRGYFFIATNVTELRRAQERLEEANDALRQADEFTRLVADNIPGRVAYWDRDLRCRFVNKVYCEWFGVTPDDVIGRTFKEVFGTGPFEAVEPYIRAALAGQAQHFDSQEPSVSGQRAITLIHYTPDIVEDEVRGFFVLGLDVTQSRHAEQTLQELNLELVKARDKAQAAGLAKSVFLANMSHEIRTPMNAIIGLTYLLRRDLAAPASAGRLARVSDAADHLMDIINNILDLSKIESGKLVLEHAEFNLEALVTRARGLVEEQAAQKGLALVTETHTLPRIVRGDATRLSQALVNLLANAVKFTTEGSVSLSGEVESVQGNDLRLRFEVRDTGIGIPPGRIEHVFNAFEQGDGSTTRRFGGTGLGLGITRQLARLMGGDAGATSEEGVGSMFWISVTVEAVQAAPAPAANTPLRGLRALLVDDTEDARSLVSTLRHLGLQVELATSGEHALAAAKAADFAGDPYDVMLIESALPHMSGLQTVRRLQAQCSDDAPPCILIANVIDDALREKAGRFGITSLLARPISFSSLYDQLMSTLSRKQAEATAGSPYFPAEHTLRDGHTGARVLLAEDNPVNQDVASTLLEKAGLQVDVANNGAEAVAMAKATPYQLILMDIQMPELDGLQATRQLRLHPATEKTPIVAMTANAYAEDRAECLAAGMNDYLTKPVDPAVLYEVIGRWLTLAESPSPAPQPVLDAVSSLDDIDGLNVARGLAFFAGDETVFRRVLKQFAELYGAGVASAGQYLAAPAEPAVVEALRRELHSIGGACAAVGAQALGEQATRIGEMLRRAGASGTVDAEVGPALSALVMGLTRLVGVLVERVGETADAPRQEIVSGQ